MVSVSEPDSLVQEVAGKRRPAAPIPLATRIKARNLYVLQQIGASAVAAQTGLTTEQVYSLAAREGWTKARAMTKAREIEKHDAKALEAMTELTEATAMEASELTMETFRAAKEAMAKGGPFLAKDMQAWSTATKNYVGIWRQAKGLDSAQQQANAAPTLNVSMFFMRGPASEATRSEPAHVEPASEAIEVSASVIEQPALPSPEPVPVVESAQPIASPASPAPAATASAPLDFYAMRAAQRAKRSGK